MRTTIVIDDDLMATALKLTGATSKKEVVELGLRTLIRLKRQEAVKAFKGKLPWDANLDEFRKER
jgi:Arc/MetJ family transcription regulator